MKKHTGLILLLMFGKSGLYGAESKPKRINVISSLERLTVEKIWKIFSTITPNDVRIPSTLSSSIISTLEELKPRVYQNTTFFHMALFYGHLRMIDAITQIPLDNNNETPFIDVKNFFGQTPLHEAVRKKRSDSVQTLIKLGANLNIKDDPLKQTALHIAIEECEPQIAETLINAGADFDAEDLLGEVPLLYAIRKNQIETALLLITKKANPNIKTTLGETGLSLARKKDQSSIIKALIDAGAK